MLENLDLGDVFERLEALTAEQDALDAKVEDFKRELVAKTLGKEPRMLTQDDLKESVYNRRRIPERFGQFPDRAQEALETAIEATFNRLRRESAVGKKIMEIESLTAKVDDAIMSASTHTKLETAWESYEEELAALQESLPADRHQQLVRCSRNRGGDGQG